MKITKAIVSSNDNPMYLDFWDSVSKLWKLKFGIEPVLLYFGENVDKVSDKYGTVIDMEILEGIPVSTQAQCSRIWYSGQCGDEVVITSDIDMLPLSPKYYVDSIANVSDDKFVSLNPLNNNTYFPMCYNVGKSSTLKDILDIDTDWETFMTKLIKWAESDECEDHYGNGNYWSLDETWTSKHVNEYPNRDIIHPIPRPNGVNGFRIDRPNWTYDVNLIAQDYYYDSHSIRPYSEHKESIDQIVNTSLKVGLEVDEGIAGYGSHVPVISEIIDNFGIKDVMEFGTGFFSTGVFVDKCDTVLSFEMQYDDWFEKVADRYSDEIDKGILDIHCIIEDSGLQSIEYIKNEFPNRQYDMVFVDGAGGSRYNCANFAKDYTDLIVLHDTEQPAYGWSKIVRDGDWVWLDVKIFNTWTSVFTKRKDIIDFVNNMDYTDMMIKYRTL